ncbi:hypothetical protein STCU_06144 [Strigomonas culicis]|uniref:Uncharacterized protein n=1 Tax=Strigomonas culicis TaxID=28005 RepID=S9UD70_9TRYP|nr:hypothetical protein STCU_06144 [Strigomonas culicis]|eukprot:EPY26659.1 hypothetical protein STCU_06144 [Strigomonas culicis]
MGASPLWEAFCEKLQDSGYTLDDLQFCSDDLFTTVVRELRCFTPAQVEALREEWLRSVKDTRPTASSDVGSPSPASRPQAHPSSIRVLNDASSFGTDRDHESRTDSYMLPTSASVLQHAESAAATGGDPIERSVDDLAARAQQLLQTCVGPQRRVAVDADGMVLIEHVAATWCAFRQRADALHAPGRPQLLWKLLSPPTLRRIEHAARGGGRVHLTSRDDVDGLCPSATVLYTDAARALGVAVADAAVPDGWALAACEVLVGRARSVSETEVGNLKHYPTAQCFDMLDEAGFDSLEIPTRHAVALFHEEQVLPHYVVYFSLEAEAPRQPRLVTDGPAGRGAVAVRHAAPASPPVPTTCAVHPHKQVEFWSPGEKRLLCSLCLYYDGYSRDTCLPIEQAAREEAPRLERWTANALTFTKEINSVFDLFDAAAGEVQRVREQQEAHVKEAFAHLHTRLSALETDVLRQTVSASRQREQELQSSRADITAVVREVEALLQRVEAPLNLYRGGSTEPAVCVHVLQLTQRAFGDWEPVRISPYSIATASIEPLCKDIEAALRQPVHIVTAAGTQELPEAIDINYLKAEWENN